jgi:hypothetical protein
VTLVTTRGHKRPFPLVLLNERNCLQAVAPKVLGYLESHHRVVDCDISHSPVESAMSMVGMCNAKPREQAFAGGT